MWLMVIVLLVLALSLLVAYSKYRHNYWASRGVPTAPHCIPIFGHMHKATKRQWEFVDEVYRNHEGSNIVGMYQMFAPVLMIGNPDLVKCIFIKDFDHFVDRRTFKFTYDDDDIFNHFLTNASDSHWKGVRSVLSPSFTSGRLKGMFPLVKQKADYLVKYMKRQTDSSLVVRKTFTLYTLEVIASCAFGMESEAFTNENSPFYTKAAELFQMNTLAMIKGFILLMFPKLCEALNISFMTDAMLFFVNAVKESIKQREAGLYRGDFLDLMIEAREDQQDPTSKLPKYPLTENTIIANSVLFILAGLDNTAHTISLFAFLLAKHPEIQQQLREELQEIVKENGELTYQSVMEAKFLDACLSETLRTHTPVHFTERKCTKEYRVPGTDVVIPPKMMVSVPIYSIHHDERYWPEPEEFRPDRFMPENKENIKSGTYLPFGAGPRNCIGMRFALMEIKLAIAEIVLNFEISCAPGFEQLKLSDLPGIMKPIDEFRIAFNTLPSNI